MSARLVVVALAVIAALATARLGVWQLDRAEQKNALQTAIDKRASAPPLTMSELATDEAQSALHHHRLLNAVGEWQSQHTVYLENRQMGGRPGFYVVTPLKLEDGSAVLVQRGWLPRDGSVRDKVKSPALPIGQVQLLTRVAPPPARLFEFDGEASGVIRQNISVAVFARETGLRLRPLSLVQLDAKEVAADGLQRDWHKPAADVHKHYGYAFQWFALSALVLVLTLWFQFLGPYVKAKSK